MGKIVVIGAGISGLVAARDLQIKGHEVLVLEKSRSLSGRCSSRRWQGHIVDHGAQYFTVTSDVFRDELQQLSAEQLKPIQGAVIDDTGQELPASGGERYYYVPGNNRIGKVLSEGMDVRKEALVERIEHHDDRFTVLGNECGAVLVTTPWPQAASIINVTAPNPDYIPCLTTFFEFDGDFIGESKHRYALSLRCDEEPLAWSACENYKQGRIQGNKTVFVVQASEKFSRSWLEEPPEVYEPLLLQRLKEHWNIAEDPSATFSHRWRYARKGNTIQPPELPTGIFVAGDSRVDSKIESVWLDGKRAADEVDHYLRGA